MAVRSPPLTGSLSLPATYVGPRTRSLFPLHDQVSLCDDFDKRAQLKGAMETQAFCRRTHSFHCSVVIIQRQHEGFERVDCCSARSRAIGIRIV